MSSRTTKRLLSELQEYNSAPPPGLVHLAPTDDDDLLRWSARLAGPPDTAFADRTFHLLINIPTAYPAQPPTMSFQGRVFHPNVHYKTGEICLDVLKEQWSPVWTLSSACLAVQALLAAPEPSSPLNVDAGRDTTPLRRRWSSAEGCEGLQEGAESFEDAEVDVHADGVVLKVL